MSAARHAQGPAPSGKGNRANAQTQENARKVAASGRQRKTEVGAADGLSAIDMALAVRLGRDTWRWRQAVQANPATARGADMAVAVALLEFVNRGTGSTWVGAERLAERSGYVVRSVRRALHALAEAGFLRIVRRGRMRTNLMFLALPNERAPVSEREDSGVRVSGHGSPPNLRLNPREEPKTVEVVPQEARDPSPVKDFLSREEHEPSPERAQSRPSEEPADPLVGWRNGPITDGHGASTALERTAMRLAGFERSSLPPRDDGARDAAMREAVAFSREMRAAIGRERWVALGRRILEGDCRESDVALVLLEVGFVSKARAA